MHLFALRKAAISVKELTAKCNTKVVQNVPTGALNRKHLQELSFKVISASFFALHKAAIKLNDH